MPQKPLQLKIDAPCSQRWSNMKPNAGGRYCQHCAKTVIDFTGYTDSELYQFFNKKQEGICGRLLPNQINKTLPHKQKIIGQNFQKIAASYIAAIALSNISANAQLLKHPGNNTTQQPAQNKLQTNSTLPANTISGILIDTAKDYNLSDIIILLNKKKMGTVAEDGRFNIIIDKLKAGINILSFELADGHIAAELDFTQSELPLQKNLYVVPLQIECTVIAGGITAYHPIEKQPKKKQPLFKKK